LFPVFPVLFPLCSQSVPDSGKCFQRVPYVLRPRRSPYHRSFLYSLFSAWEHWEQWERNRDRRRCASSAVELSWNDWEQISGGRQMPSLSLTVIARPRPGLKTQRGTLDERRRRRHIV